MRHDNFDMPLNGYDKSQISRQDFDDGLTSTGIGRPDAIGGFGFEDSG